MSEENKPVEPESRTPKGTFELTPSISIIIAGALIAGSIVFVNFNSSQPAVAGDGQLPPNVNVPKPSGEDHIVGSPTAPIVLVEYSDFQCPYCAMVYPTLKRIVSESNGQIAWAHRHLPLTTIHPQAMPAALASECIAEQLGNDGFFKFTDAIYPNQNKMNPAYYEELAVQLGADAAKFASCFSSQKYKAKIEKEAMDAQVNGATGTPFTVIVGNNLQVPVSGALPYPQFMSVIKAVQDRQ